MACGEIGLNINYFYSLTPREFYNIVIGYRKKEEANFKNRWYQTREIVLATLQPHVKKGKKLEYPFEWEKTEKPKRVMPSREELLKRFEKVDESLKKKQ